MTTPPWLPEPGAEYSEIWMVGPDSSVVMAPSSAAGEPRPGAAALLVHQAANQRNTVKARVRAYARGFKRGVAPATWDALAISSDGLTGNGIHRLLAIVDSGATVKLLVLLNVSQEALDLGDQGQKRNIRQSLRRHGYEHPDVTGSAATMMHRWLIGRGPGDRRDPVTWDDVSLVLADHPGLDGFGLIGRQLSSRGALHSHGLGAMLAYLMCQIDPKGGPVFIQRWITDDISSGRDPVHHLRKWLENQYAAAHGTKGGVDVTEKGAMVILARNADMRGEQPEKIIWRRNREARAPEFPRFLMPADREETDLELVLKRFVAVESSN